MRIRSTKPDFWKSDDIASLKDWHDRLVFIGLWNYVDDNGVGRDNERLITSELFGLEDDPREASSRVRRALANLAKRGLIARYEGSDGRRYVYVTNWHHQKIDRPSKPRYPLPTCENALFDEHSSSIRRGLDGDSLRAPEDQGSGIRGSEDQGSVSSAAKLLDSERFDEFWSAYPRPEGKKPAEASYAKAMKRITHPDLMAHLHRQLNDPNSPDEGFWPYAASWLNQDRWTDTFTAKTNGRASPRTNGYQPSTSEQRAGQAMALAEQYAAEEAATERRTQTHALEIGE